MIEQYSIASNWRDHIPSEHRAFFTRSFIHVLLFHTDLEGLTREFPCGTAHLHISKVKRHFNKQGKRVANEYLLECQGLTLEGKQLDSLVALRVQIPRATISDTLAGLHDMKNALVFFADHSWYAHRMQLADIQQKRVYIHNVKTIQPDPETPLPRRKASKQISRRTRCVPNPAYGVVGVPPATADSEASQRSVSGARCPSTGEFIRRTSDVDAAVQPTTLYLPEEGIERVTQGSMTHDYELTEIRSTEGAQGYNRQNYTNVRFYRQQRPLPYEIASLTESRSDDPSPTNITPP